MYNSIKWNSRKKIFPDRYEKIYKKEINIKKENVFFYLIFAAFNANCMDFTAAMTKSWSPPDPKKQHYLQI